VLGRFQDSWIPEQIILRGSKKTQFNSKGIDSDSSHNSSAEMAKNMLKRANKLAQFAKKNSKIVLYCPDDM
jgi:hypothetical protein